MSRKFGPDCLTVIGIVVGVFCGLSALQPGAIFYNRVLCAVEFLKVNLDLECPPKQPIIPVVSTNTPVPQNGLIAFTRESDIYTVKFDGSDVVRLTNGINDNLDPMWSPDGQQIAFRLTQGGKSDIYIMDRNGKGLTRLTMDGNNQSPAWSPDGLRLAFRSDREGKWNIYVVDIYSKAITRLTRQGDNDSPTWSPDGQWIAFDSNKDGGWNIYKMMVDGSKVSRLTDRGGKSPAWSPDGQRIAFMSSRDGNANIYVMGTDGIPVTRLTQLGYNDMPVWSPDGQKIIFQSGSTFGSAVYAINMDGTGNKQLIIDNGLFPSWQPIP